MQYKIQKSNIIMIDAEAKYYMILTNISYLEVSTSTSEWELNSEIIATIRKLVFDDT